MPGPRGTQFVWSLREASGALGDLGTLLPLLLGAALLILALLPQGTGIAALTLVPTAGLGALLLVASGELALTRRLVDSKPSCWPVIAATAAATLWLDPFWGLVAGSVGEVARQAVLRAAAARVSGRRH